MTKIKIALQKSGRLHVESIKTLNDCGIYLNLCYKDKLRVLAKNYPIEIFFLRDDDIPKYIQNGIADIGIVGKNVVCEQQKDFLIKERLGFGVCKLVLAIPKDSKYKNVKDLFGKRIATTYPNLLKVFLKKHNISSDIVSISGSVEMTPDLKVADAICDIVSSGETLFKNNLKEIDQVFLSEAVLLCCPESNKKHLVNMLLSRIIVVKTARKYKYIFFFATKKKLDKIYYFLMKNKPMEIKIIPISIPIRNSQYINIQSIVEENMVFQTILKLKIYGAKNIIVLPIQGINI